MTSLRLEILKLRTTLLCHLAFHVLINAYFPENKITAQINIESWSYLLTSQAICLYLHLVVPGFLRRLYCSLLCMFLSGKDGNNLKG